MIIERIEIEPDKIDTGRKVVGYKIIEDWLEREGEEYAVYRKEEGEIGYYTSSYEEALEERLIEAVKRGSSITVILEDGKIKEILTFLKKVL